MKILIIGGTRFVGRHLINASAANGHHITIFHRGKHSSKDIPEVDEILGDRNNDLDRLAHQKWDAVIDTCGYLPQHVRASCEALRDATDHYVFISSISAYAGFSDRDFDENAPLARLTDKQSHRLREIDPKSEINGYTLGEMYGALKAMCEESVQQVFPQNHLVIRPGLVVGKYDWTDRFTYWVMRVAKGGAVLAPGNPASYVQFIDGADLADWTIKMIEDGESGIYNAVGKPFELTFGQMLDEIKSASGGDADFTWVDDKFMSENKVEPWTEMPLYIPETDETRGFSAANIDRALRKGIGFRDLSETIAETLDWRSKKGDELKAGISNDREQELLKLWGGQNPG